MFICLHLLFILELKGECSVFETIMSKENPLVSDFAGIFAQVR